MSPEVVLRIDALDNTKAAFDNVKKNLTGLEKSTSSFRDTIQNLQPTFQKMAVGGGAAFAAISGFSGIAVKAAADAEVAWTKFDVVFGDSAQDMREFVSQVRRDIPLAERVIAKMTAGLGDMLVPMGFTRVEAAEMSKGFVSVAAGVAAFNNVDPSEVLNAVQSGLAGSGDALRRFGINADMGRLEMLALDMGLIEAGQSLNSLDSETRRYIQSQALLEAFTRDSSDAVAGLAKEKETLAFKMREAGARMQEMRETIGAALMPVVTQLFDALRPVIEQLAVWIENNPTLVRNIIIATGAIAGIALVLGTLGLVILPIIAGFKAIAVVVLALSSPIGLIVLALGGLGFALYKLWQNWDSIWESIKEATVGAYNWIKTKAIDPLVGAFERVLSIIERVREGISSIGGKVGTKISNAGSSVSRILGDVTPFADGGIVTRPTLGLVGEAGPEAIIPLSKAGALGGGGITINISGTFMDDRAAARRMGDELMRVLKQQQRI